MSPSTVPSIQLVAQPMRGGVERLPPAPPAPRLSAFLELGFRPLYLAGAAWAAIAVAIWIYAPWLASGPLAGIAWHAHEMLWGFIATIAVGFLMTAGANWTGVNPLAGRPLAFACLLWIVARAGLLVDSPQAFTVAAVAEVAFFLFAAGAMMRVVYATRNKRNYAVPWLLVALALADVAYLAAARAGDHALLMRQFDAGFLAMALIALLITRRVIPFFAMRAVAGLVVPMQTRIGHAQLALGLVAIACGEAGFARAEGAALAIVGVLALWQVVRWKPLAVRGRPLLWILYVGYAGLGIGLVAAGCAAAGIGRAPPALPVHVIAMAGFAVLVIGMVTRTALGHLGRALALDRSMLASYVLVLVAAALRLAALWPSAMTLLLLQLAAAAWIAAFALYVVRFAPMMIRPRA
jgi:uncharacterized protein involved in response to NO